MSRLWWQDEDPRDKRIATDPELAVDHTFADYVVARDPALELALTPPSPLTIEQTLEKAPAWMARLPPKAYVGDPLHGYLLDPERRLNSAAYNLPAEKRVQDAIVIFEINARTHPNSSNANDSLGDGYLAANDREHALRAYKALG